MIESHGQVKTVTISIFQPLIAGGNAIRNIDEEVSAYSHTISVDGGFASASIKLATSLASADDWLANGLGRHIVVRGVSGAICWEGFVNSVTVNIGNVSVQRGPLVDICNRCLAEYTPILGYDNETGEPITGDTAYTALADDTESIQKYGIWEKMVDAGTADEELFDEATLARDMYLNDSKDPVVSYTPSIGEVSASDTSISLDCKGYYEWLSNYIYEDETELSVEVSDKIGDIIADDPNGIFSTVIGHLKYNGVLTNALEVESRPAKDIILEAVELGDVNNNRWIFGIYEERIPYYQPIPTTVEYHYYASSDNPRLLNTSNAEIYPWDIRAGWMVLIPDVILGELPNFSGLLKEDERVMFIEEVTYTAPYRAEIKGAKVLNLPQYLARLGAA